MESRTGLIFARKSDTTKVELIHFAIIVRSYPEYPFGKICFLIKYASWLYSKASIYNDMILDNCKNNHSAGIKQENSIFIMHSLLGK